MTCAMKIQKHLSLVILVTALFGSALAASGSDDRVDKLTPEHRTWLEEEVIYIITDKERDAFLSLQSVETLLP